METCFIGNVKITPWEWSKTDRFLEHSAKGTTWKKHKYIRKVGLGKYIYKTDKTKASGGRVCELC